MIYRSSYKKCLLQRHVLKIIFRLQLPKKTINAPYLATHTFAITEWKGNVLAARHAFGNSSHLQKSQVPNLLLIRFSISADSPGGLPCFYFLVLFNVTIQNLRKGGIVSTWRTMWKDNQACVAPRFLEKTMIDANFKNHSQMTLAIMQILGCNHFKEHPSYTLSEPASPHLMPFFVQISITLLPGLKCSSRGSQNFRVDAEAPQPHYYFLWLPINRVPFQGLGQVLSEKQSNEAINKTEPLTQHIPVRSWLVKASKWQKKPGQRRCCWGAWALLDFRGPLLLLMWKWHAFLWTRGKRHCTLLYKGKVHSCGLKFPS